jgi:DNA polymerase I
MLVNQVSQLNQVQSILTSRPELPIAIDTETNWTDSHADRFCMGVSIAQGEDYWYIPVGHKPIVGMPQENIEYLPVEFFKALEPFTIIMHNAKFDLHVLRSLGYEGRFLNLFDTMLMHHFINENDLHDLDTLSNKYCTVVKNAKLKKALMASWDNSPIYGMERYAQEDAVATLQLYDALRPSFGPYEAAWNEVDRYFLYCLLDMEQRGIPIDKRECAKLEIQCRERMDKIKAELGWDCGSSNLLQEKLFGEVPKGYGLKPLSHTDKGKPQINKNFLEKTNHPVCGLILEYRELQKQASSYYANYLRIGGINSRLHPVFKMHGTVTGRLSCENPNLQQIPRDSGVKKMFLPEAGQQLWEIDFRNLEMRMAAVYSQCAPLLEVFQNEGDVHQTVADSLGISRQLAKIVNFLLIYGGGAEALSYQAKIGFSQAKRVYGDYRRNYPELFRFAENAEALAQSKGQVRLFSGRVRHFKYQSECRKAFNAVVQGGGFELVKRSMLRLEKAGFDMRNQVHDSVWINCNSKTDAEEAAHHMSDWTKEDFGLLFSTDVKRLN